MNGGQGRDLRALVHAARVLLQVALWLSLFILMLVGFFTIPAIMVAAFLFLWFLLHYVRLARG